MTTSPHPGHAFVEDDDTEPTAEEIETIHREMVVLDPDSERAGPRNYPRLWNLSAGPIFPTMVRALAPERPEYVTVSLPELDHLEAVGTLGRWNLLWEAAQFRRRFFDPVELPPPMERIAERGDLNVVFVPRTRTRFFEYAPLAHLLPRATLERFGLPLLAMGQWPMVALPPDVDRFLPADFDQRLGRAWAATVWQHLGGRSPMRAFSPDDPVRLLAHNLDFWLPAVTEVIQDLLQQLPEADRGVEEGPVTLADGRLLPGARWVNPRMGSDLWRGEDEAGELVRGVVEQADVTGRLGALLDTVRSGRVEDDFSDRWSWERADFERRLHHSRAQVSVRFVELPDTIPVHGPETEVVDRVAFGDFMTLLNERDRQIVVVLRSGTGTVTDAAEELGYANHSAVSKRLARIRRQAIAFFGERS